MTTLCELITITGKPQPDSAFTFYKVHDTERFGVAAAFYKSEHQHWWATPTEHCGDLPQKVHPKYVMALLASSAIAQENAQRENIQKWLIPDIHFETDEWTRRSMTLNGMRMSTEYFQSGSPRIFQLIEQRLAARQKDVVHDVLVYLAAQVLEAQAEAREARYLQAESLAAYLGLNLASTEKLLLAPKLSASELSRKIADGFAGEVKRKIEIPSLIENQFSRLLPELEKAQARESQVLEAIDRVAEQLFGSSRSA